MCFAPEVSVGTALFEFIVASYLLTKHSRLSRFAAIFVYLLGFYQFTEFMLCISDSSVWPLLGFITYSFLPVVAFHFTVKKLRSFYLIPVLFALYALTVDFAGYCSTVFVVVHASFSQFMLWLYCFYYFGFVALATFFAFRTYRHEKRVIFLLGAITAIITLLIPVILILILPRYGIMFPSVYCEAAVLFSVIALFI